MSPAIRNSVLAGVVAGLGLLNGSLLVVPVETSALMVSGPVGAGRQIVDSTPQPSFRLDATTPSDFPEMASRPLFWPGRRPRPAALAAVAPPAPQSTEQTAAFEFQLTGVLHDGGNARRALIVWPQQPSGRWVEVGADLAGWRLTGIGHHSIEIEDGGRRHELKLR